MSFRGIQGSPQGFGVEGDRSGGRGHCYAKIGGEGRGGGAEGWKNGGVKGAQREMVEEEEGEGQGEVEGVTSP